MALFGIFVGVLARMIVPALRKKAEDSDKFKWDHTYTAIALFSLIIAIATTFIGFLAFPLPESVTPLPFFITSVVYGFGLNATITEIMKWSLER